MKLDLRSADLQLHFPDKLAEALGPTRTAEPALNPVARPETVRFVNGLPRRKPSVSWLEPERMAPARREAALESLAARLDRDHPALKRLGDLLDRRRNDKNHVLAAVTRGGLSTREI